MASDIERCLLCNSLIPCSKEQRNILYGEGIKIKKAIRDFLLNVRVNEPARVSAHQNTISKPSSR